MKFKYMMRGLGLGVIITAAVMGAYGRKAVADARVAVLREYGLGKDNTPDIQDGIQDESGQPESDTVATEPVIARNEDIEAEISSVLDQAKESEQAPAETKESTVDGSEAASASEQPEDASKPDNGDGGDDASKDNVIKITISNGDGSATVARKLVTAGLIENAGEYDAWLVQKGYDKKLSTGTKEITVDENWDEPEKWRAIAEKITSK